MSPKAFGRLMRMKLGSRQSLCWVWTGISRKARREILSIMATDETLTRAPAYRKAQTEGDGHDLYVSQKTRSMRVAWA